MSDVAARRGPVSRGLPLILSGLALAVAAASLILSAERTAAVTASVVERKLLTEPNLLRGAIAVMQADDRRIAAEADRELVRANPAVFEGGATLGNPRGTKVLVEFMDYSCPHCRRSEPALAALIAADPELKVVVHEMPVLGEGSVAAAAAALAADSKGRYAEMRAAILARKPPYTAEAVRAAAAAAGLDPAEIEAAAANPDVGARFERSKALAAALRIQGTPAFVSASGIHRGAADPGALGTLLATR